MKKKSFFESFYFKSSPAKHIFRIKLLPLLVLFILLFNFHPESLLSQDLKFSFKETDVSLERIINSIEKQSNYLFVYTKDVDTKKTYRVNIRQSSVADILNSLFKGTNIFYEIKGNYIVLSVSQTGGLDAKSNNQARLVTGKVVTADGEPIIGANVVEKGTMNGTVTDLDGTFSMDLSSNSVLQISYIGYLATEKRVGDQRNITIQLAEDSQSLDEVVVVGYGTVRKRELTGAVGSVSSDEISSIPVSRFEQAIQGRIAGVNITQSGVPGGDVNVRIRGVGTLNNNSPLFVIDGIPVFGDNGLSSLNPNDISSIEVLKDGASAAIYGARAANGVVLVTTKRGKEGKTSISYNGSFTIQTIAKKLEVLDGYQYALLQNEARAAQGVDPLTPDWLHPENITGAANTDWQDEILRTAPAMEHTLTISGGNGNASYLISGNYIDQQGIVKESDFKRYSLRVNTDATALKIINIGSSLQFSKNKKNLLGDGGIVNTAVSYSPLIPVKFDDGSWGAAQGDKDLYLEGINPVARLALGKNTEDAYRFMGNLFAEIKIWDGLKYRFSYSLNIMDTRNENFMPSYNHGPSTFVNQAALSVINARSLEYAAENIVSYNKTFNDKHDLSITGVFSAQEMNYNNESGSTIGLVNNNIPYLTNNTGNRDVNSANYGYALLSYVGRINYSYDQKYLFSATIRRDGSSRFGKNNPWANFPAFSAGWRISQEPFMNNVKFVDDLKLRASWGKSGNQEIGNYAFVASLGSNLDYVLGSSQSLAPGVGMTSLPNPDLKWESSAQTNVGVDMTLFNNSVTLSANYYYKKTNDILLQVPIPRFSGVTVFPTQNKGSLENKGVELEIGYRKAFGDLFFEVNGNLSTNKNKVLRLADENPIFDGTIVGAGQARGGENITITREGDPIGSFYGYVMDGIFQNQAQIDQSPSQGTSTRPGDVKFKNTDEDDSVIDINDRTIIGNPFPDFTYGLSTNLAYKGFELNLFFQGVQGNDIYNGTRAIWANMYDLKNNLTEVLDRWRGEGTSNTVPRAVKFDPSQNGRVSSRWVEDGSYLRLKNLTIGYNLPRKLLSRWGIQNIKIYATGINLLTFTNYKGIDPEIAENGSNVKFAGIDYATYPMARTISFGLKIDL